MRVGRKYTAVFVSLIILICSVMTGCTPSYALKRLKVENCIDFYGKGNQFRQMSIGNEAVISSADGVGLHYDEKTSGISFVSRDSSGVWSSLPETENQVAANFYVKVFYEGSIYQLDTAFNAVGNGSVTKAIDEDGMTLTYDMRADGFSVILPVRFTLKGSVINVSIDMKECKASENAVILSVSVLPFMGALSYSENSTFDQLGDYFLLPDGPGAIVSTAIEDDSFSSALFSVYGKELYEESIPASVAAFGIKSLNDTLSVTVTEGDENALIRVYRSNFSDDGINRVYPEFIITPISGESGSVYCGEAYTGKIQVCYEPVSSENADYITMAICVRQTLINAGFMDTETVEEGYPFFVSVVNSIDGTKKGTLTSFQQTENLLSLLKGKGVNNIELILEGAFSGGLEQKNNLSLRPLSSCGGFNDINSLCEYASSQQINVYGGLNFSSSASKSSSIKNISGDRISTEIANTVYSSCEGDGRLLYYKDYDRLSGMSSNAIRLTEKTGLDGICVTDSEISAFYASSSEIGFAEYTEEMNSGLSAVSITSEIMLDGCNMNIIKNGDILRNVSFETVIPESESYKAVPFIPALLHSSFIYTGRPVNDSAVTRLSLLRYIEYGAAPHYLWCFDSKNEKYYDNDINEAAAFYVEALNTLNELSSKRITGHSMYEEGVYCTEYEGGTKIYVNYNNYSVILGDISVMPYDFLRIG